MADKKKMYVVFCEDNEKYWCSYNTWSDQLRKATIFHSTKYANEVHKRFKELRLKNVEVRIEVVPEKPTNADRIRSMSDEELVEFIKKIKVRAAFCKAIKNNDAFEGLCSAEWLQQPVEENKNGV